MRRRVPTMVYSTLLKLRPNFFQMPSWCGAFGGLNLHLMPLCAISARGNMERVLFLKHSRSLFAAPMKFVSSSEKNHSRRTPTGDEPLHSHYTGASVHGRNHFNMDSASSQTSDEKSPPLLGSPKNGDVEWAEVTNPCVGKGRTLVCESLVCCTELSTQNAV